MGCPCEYCINDETINCPNQQELASLKEDIVAIQNDLDERDEKIKDLENQIADLLNKGE